MNKWIRCIPAALAALPLLISPAGAVKPTKFYKKPAVKQMLKGYFQQRNRMAFLTEGYMTTIQSTRGTTRRPQPVSNLSPLRMDYGLGAASQVELRSITVKSLERGQWRLEAELGTRGHQGLEKMRTLPVTVKGNSLKRLRQEIGQAFRAKRATGSSTPVLFE